MAHVLIVGAGPAGASLAYLLAHRGVDVTLLERIQSLQTLPPRIVLSREWWGEPLRHLTGKFLGLRFVQTRMLGPNDPFLFGVTDVRLCV